ncbi:MAG: 16S rRNA (cytidine(1402)-2'-O)-methyltransferase [Acidobacteriota bacterium]|jgi:16S rRNA (cytidine1402-2'-O)-methyltransferase|nr:16S rRNA (cytidine(1402)-2'-O)-methyltransferase [Acidobacteriota bacterium]
MGTLYLVATPIGNLEDITLRALRVLREVALVACEDTRHTSKLLAHYGIATPRKSYHEFNEECRVPQLLALLRAGEDVALVSDAGTPLVSDPGFEIVAACRREGLPVIPVPGASAAVAALVGSGLPSDSFHFAGFLPSRGGERRRRLEELSAIPATLVLYEAPHRLLDSLQDMADVLGPRRAALCRELTKMHEEFLCGTLPEVLDGLRERPEVRGEITLVVERGGEGGRAAAPPGYPASIKEHLDAELSGGALSRNEALKAVARKRGIRRKEAYRLLQGELDSTP